MKKNPLAYQRVIDKIKLPEQFDKRKKLTEQDKNTIRKLYKETKHTYRSLAELYGVVFGTIQTTVDEKRRIKNLAIARKYQKRNREELNKKKKGTLMDLRYRKKELILKGKIKLDNFTPGRVSQIKGN